MRHAFLALVTVLGLLLFSSREARADEERTWDPTMTVVGLSAAAGGYAYAAFMGAAVYRRDDGKPVDEMFVPIVGPWLALRDKARFSVDSLVAGRLVTAGVHDCHGDLCGVAVIGGVFLFLPEVFVLVADPLAQAGGIVLAIAGATQTKPSRDHVAVAPKKPSWSVKPAAIGSGSGVVFSVTNW